MMDLYCKYSSTDLQPFCCLLILSAAKESTHIVVVYVKEFVVELDFKVHNFRDNLVDFHCGLDTLEHMIEAIHCKSIICI